MPGVVLQEINNSQTLVSSDPSSSNFLIVGTAGNGPLGTITPVNGLGDLYSLLGPITKDHLGLIAAKQIISNGGNVIYYRVAGTSKKKATVTAGSVVITAKQYGKAGNNLSVVVTGTSPWTVKVLLNGTVVETFTGIVGSPTSDPKYIDLISSNYVVFDDTPTTTFPAGTYQLSTGDDGVFADMAAANADVVNALTDVLSLESLDVDVILAPGFVNAAVNSQIISVAQNRADCVGIVDYALGTPIATVQTSGTWNSSFAAAYWPWVQIYDGDADQTIWMPPAAIGAAQMATSDKLASIWFAPAGVKRGVVTQALALETNMSSAQREAVYAANVNPIVKMPGVGYVVFGQKDLELAASSTDRLNNRRTLNYIKKNIKKLTQSVVFDPIDPIFFDNWKSPVNAFLESIKQRRGLASYKVIMDYSIATPDLLAQNKVPGIIKLSLMGTAETITLSFVVGPQGVTFQL